MRARLVALVPLVLVLALLLPGGGIAEAQIVDVATRVDVIDRLAPVTGRPQRPAVTGDEAATDGVTPVITAPRRSPIRFSMLAFTAPRRASVEYRTSLDGRTWSSWRRAEGAEGVGPDAGTAEAGGAQRDHRRSGEPMWVGDARWLQARVAGAAPSDVHVDVIDSMGLSRTVAQRLADAVRSAVRGTTAGAPAHAAGQPAVVSRSQWGADETLRSGTPVRAERARYAILHHTVNSNSYTRAEAKGVVRGIYAYHTRSRGWSDIGYNFLVDRFGTIYEGRAGGLTAAVVGAHTLGFNTGSIGVAMIGDHGDADVTSATRGALARLLAWQFAEHGIDPTGTVRITSACTGSCKRPNGSIVELPTLFAHRDVGYTSCPGARGYALLPGLRTAVADIDVAVLSNPSVEPNPNTLTPAGLLEPLRASVDLLPGGAWELVIKDDDGGVVHRASGEGTRADVSWSGHAELRAGRYWYKFTSGARTPEVGSFRIARVDYDPPFSDDDDSVHAPAIDALYARGVTKGCTSTTFCPARMVSRAQMASFIARTMDNLLVSRPVSPPDHYTDDEASVHQEAINSLAAAAVVTGCGAEAFCPTDDALRGDVALWLASAFDLPPPTADHFADDDGTEHEWAINALAEAGLTEGCTADAYCPADPTSRGQMASFLSRAINRLEADGLAG